MQYVLFAKSVNHFITPNHIDKRGRIEYEKNNIGIGAKIGTYYELDIKFQIFSCPCSSIPTYGTDGVINSPLTIREIDAAMRAHVVG